MVDFVFSQLFDDDFTNENPANPRDSSRFINWRLYDSLKKLILNGTLPPSYRLPSSRLLSQQLSVSRNTVLYAYEQLLAEGFVSTKHGSGTFVNDVFVHSRTNDSEDNSASITYRPLSNRGKNLIKYSGATNNQWGAFVSGVPDVSVFPHKLWARLLSRVWRHQINPNLLTYAQQGGYMPLRQAIAEHLRIVRAANCDAEQVIITSGIHQALDIAAHILADPGEVVWMEEPSYWGVKSVMATAGLEIEAIPVDNEGLAPLLRPEARKPRLIFATPSHQYPLGKVMSITRRHLLLDIAQQHDAWIIEDDYDSEFRFDGRPLASLQGLDRHNRVIYMGTFSKTMFPGIRIGFMVVPKNLIHVFSQGLSELYREGQMAQQMVLTEFINNGHYSNHIRRMKILYSQRRDLLHNAILRRFNNSIDISNQDAGLHLVMHFDDTVDDVQISKAAYDAGLVTRPLSSYYLGHEKPKKGMLLGYASVPSDEINPQFDKLADIIERYI